MKYPNKIAVKIPEPMRLTKKSQLMPFANMAKTIPMITVQIAT